LTSALAATTSALATLTSLSASFFSYLASLTSPSRSIFVGRGSEDTKGYVAGTVTALGTTLFLVTGIFTISFFSSPVVVSLVVTSFYSSSTTGIT